MMTFKKISQLLPILLLTVSLEALNFDDVSFDRDSSTTHEPSDRNSGLAEREGYRSQRQRDGSGSSSRTQRQGGSNHSSSSGSGFTTTKTASRDPESMTIEDRSGVDLGITQQQLNEGIRVAQDQDNSRGFMDTLVDWFKRTFSKEAYTSTALENMISHNTQLQHLVTEARKISEMSPQEYIKKHGYQVDQADYLAKIKGQITGKIAAIASTAKDLGRTGLSSEDIAAAGVKTTTSTARTGYEQESRTQTIASAALASLG